MSPREKKILDIVVKAKFRNQHTVFIIHTEHQSYSQADFERRMFTYFARLHEKYALPRPVRKFIIKSLQGFKTNPCRLA